MQVRYNDTGSLEQLNEDTIGGDSTGLALEALLPSDDNNDTETINGTRRYRELWNLRATLEEEEECSDTIRMEDMTSPDDSPDREHTHTPHTTSFESPVLSDACASDQRDSGIQWECKTSDQYGGQKPSRGALPVVEEGMRRIGRGHSLPPSAGIGGSGAAQLLHPRNENRRQSYKNILSGRVSKTPGGPAGIIGVLGPTSAENSFDSVETDGDVSDTSRQEVTTTSFESTTDNTDSTTESQQSRLRQMKTDSGYKSLETQQSGSREPEPMEIAPAAEDSRIVRQVGHDASRICLEENAKDVKRNVNRNGENTSNGNGSVGGGKHGTGSEVYGDVIVSGARRISGTGYLERKSGRTASKKRREYSRERQVIHVCESVNEPEVDSRSDIHSGDSFDDSLHQREKLLQQQLQQHHQQQGSHGHCSNNHSHSSQFHNPSGHPSGSKRSVFTRFFSHPRESREKYAVRDYSIDEKTNQIFNEFIRPDAPHEISTSLGLRRSPRTQHRARLQRKHTEPAYGDDHRRDRLVPERRSASLGSDSSASSARRMSPQDSIEEEYEEGDGTQLRWSQPELAPMLEVAGDTMKSDMRAAVVTSKGVQDIPIIKLPEEEMQEVS